MQQGTVLYVAPEVLEEKYDHACDVPSNSQELEELLIGRLHRLVQNHIFFQTLNYFVCLDRLFRLDISVEKYYL